jgi:predicted dehydrogenase
MLYMQKNNASRRSFIKKSSVVAAAGVLAPHVVTSSSAADDNRKLKIGLIGAGGRGSGACLQALTASKDNVLWSIGEAFTHKAENAINTFTKQKPGQVDVAPERVFVGIDAYQQVIDSGVDVVILTTPPGFRPQHLEAAIKAGKHVFCEKPVAVDAPGVRKVLAAAKMAKEKNLSLVCGFCWRYDYARREIFKRIHDGQIGRITSYQATYLTSPVKPMPEAAKPDGMSDVEWQVRNWYNFSWLGGDGLVEQAVHSVDKIAWAMGDKPPKECWASGGRQAPSPGGNIFDHFSVTYIYPDEVRCFLDCRQIGGSHGENSDYILGAEGQGIIGRGGKPFILGANRWRYNGPGNSMYQTEHDELFASIRKGEAKNDGEWMASSTMLAIMGRMAAYTGKKITWDEALNSNGDLAPDELAWDDDFDPGTWPIPGKTKFS